MSLIIYNTLSKKKEVFSPIKAPDVKFYVCGPTVYDLLHIGNFRGVIFFNVVRRWLERLDYSVNFVLNFTDIDDKIIARAAENNTDTRSLTAHYIEEYQKDVSLLDIKPHDINPKCTDHISDMITFITGLIEAGHAYEIDGSVFFEISTFSEYGKLSGKKLDDLNVGHRVDPDPRKRNRLDFVLWKPAKDGEPSWESPWGHGRPGWHIECSAMTHAHHGEQIDIHGGGIDLIFPHHENEIAQSECFTGKAFSKFWMHHNFIRFGDDKMSKSLGNVVKARDYMARYDAEVLKFLFLSVHYRSELSVDDGQSMQAMGRLHRIYKALNMAQALADASCLSDKTFSDALIVASEKIKAALNDDFNTPVVMACVFDVVRDFNQLTQELKAKNPALNGAAVLFVSWVRDWGQILSLFQQDPAVFLDRLNDILIHEKQVDVDRVKLLIKSRNEARSAKDFGEADKIRDELFSFGVLIQDTPEGTVWEMGF